MSHIIDVGNSPKFLTRPILEKLLKGSYWHSPSFRINNKLEGWEFYFFTDTGTVTVGKIGEDKFRWPSLCALCEAYGVDVPTFEPAKPELVLDKVQLKKIIYSIQEMITLDFSGVVFVGEYKIEFYRAWVGPTPITVKLTNSSPWDLALESYATWVEFHDAYFKD